MLKAVYRCAFATLPWKKIVRCLVLGLGIMQNEVKSLKKLYSYYSFSYYPKKQKTKKEKK